MALVCVVVFVSLTYVMTNKTKESIREISEIYMEEVNTQLQQKFESIISLRLEQVSGIVSSVSQDSPEYKEKMEEKLTDSASIRNFTYLGFCTADGRLVKIFGDDIDFSSRSDVVETLQTKKEIVAQGINEQGDKFLMLGQPAAYTLEDGEKTAALVAGISMDYLTRVLYLDEENGRVYSHIIDKEGYFVVRSGDAFRSNYFERIMEIYDVYNGKEKEDYARLLREAMDVHGIYSDNISVGGEEQQIYCAPLSDNTTWYLISVMKTSVLNEAITRLDKVRLGIMLASSMIILIAMVVVFVKYMQLATEQMRNLDKAKREAVRASHAKSEFLSSMSHDIRTPMNAIIGMTEIAMKNSDNPERIEDCLKKVLLSSKHLLGLINDVLDMSKIESGKMTLNMNPLSLKEIMDDAVNIMQPQVKAKHQYFDIFIRDILSEEVYCDEVRLNQVLINLLSNAVKFTQEEGRIDVYLYQEPSAKGGEYVCTHIEVADNGIGMSKEFQEKIWDAFSRDDSDVVQRTTGTGLGTAISKKIVDLMGGRIGLVSEPGKGSTFHIILDLKKAESIQEMKLPAWNILVVDDNEQLCLSAVSNLEELGVHAEWTMDGRNAVEMIAERHRRNDDYRFVLIDWKMSNMDGLQTIHEIHKRVGKDIPIFLISAYGWNEIEEEIVNTGIEGFIAKPLFKSTLYHGLKKYVEGNAAKEEKKETEELDFAGIRILLAEDIDINWEIADELLSAFGFETERAENGQVCVDMFKQSEVGYYKLILMDIRMPVMDGYDATRAIRALERGDKDLPIIAMTADAFDNDVQICLDCGMNAHVAKPIDMKELLQVLRRFLFQQEG